MSHNIAIDGPAGAGKSTIAKKIAEKLNYIYVDTGAMYRAYALYLLRKGIGADETEKIQDSFEAAQVGIRYENGQQVVLLGEENVNGLIRTEEVSRMASASSVNPKLREKMVKLQQQIAEKENVVMDGRDICMYVLPKAEVKVYLTASVEVRAKRRYDEMTAKGVKCSLDEIAADIAERDHRDMTREASPLQKAEDAVLIDSSDLTIDEVTDVIIGLGNKKWENTGE